MAQGERMARLIDSYDRRLHRLENRRPNAGTTRLAYTKTRWPVAWSATTSGELNDFSGGEVSSSAAIDIAPIYFQNTNELFLGEQGHYRFNALIEVIADTSNAGISVIASITDPSYGLIGRDQSPLSVVSDAGIAQADLSPHGTWSGEANQAVSLVISADSGFSEIVIRVYEFTAQWMGPGNPDGGSCN